MIEYIVNCTAWSLGGLIFGYLLAKIELDKAIRERDDDTRTSAPSPTN